MLDSITLYVGSYLSEIGDTFGGLVACINSADKAIKDFDFTGVRFLIQFVNKNTVNKFMDVFVSQFFNRGVFAYQYDKPSNRTGTILTAFPPLSASMWGLRN